MNNDIFDKRTVIFTRCPVGSGTEVLLRKGLLEKAYNKAGARIVLLQSLPSPELVKHLTQEAPLAFRDGGNVPPIWSHSRGTRTRVIGITAIKQSHAILTAPDSPIQSPEDLRGKRLAVPLALNSVVDPMRAMVTRGYQTVLDAYKIGKEEVTFVDVAVPRHIPAKGGTENSDPAFLPPHTEEIRALQSGEVDAFFSHRSLVAQIEERGLARVIIDISKTPLSNVNNIYPSIITVHEDFAAENRDLVLIYLEELLKAAEWAKEHQEESLEFGAAGQHGATREQLRKTRAPDAYKYYAPGFDPPLVDLLASQKEFLLKNHFIEKDFDLEEWLDRSFLREAQEQFREHAVA
ncbi:MAG: ABC transporter substrate-binding protein [Treponema sp.]|jgi:ABC-type nitrate/sulfonate/bicarbonate transport system substrate-binding protein|nr:ABC transporter substrate-binding protein [Treponema sp.]